MSTSLVVSSTDCTIALRDAVHVTEDGKYWTEVYREKAARHHQHIQNLIARYGADNYEYYMHKYGLFFVDE